MSSPYQAKYFAHELTRRCPSDSIKKLAGAVASAQVDLNPHQVDAALFAFKSPLSKGAIHAETGVGRKGQAAAHRDAVAELAHVTNPLHTALGTDRRCIKALKNQGSHMTTNTATPNTPASANFEKLKAKLRELFELDKADLDFGIYRVLRARHEEIAEFLDKHLEKTVREALQSHGNLHQMQLGNDLRKAEQSAKDAGIAPEQSPRVLEIREKLKSGNDLDALAGEVYSHLYTFFSRYYQEGDFLGLHRSTVHGREKYMIPYNGEEVKLVWANMDQYYIKSSELLRDYAFHVTPGAGTLLEAAATERFTVHFKLIEADTEKDNRKPSGKTTRAFALDDESPFAEEAPDTLTIRFRYREHSAERNLQDKLNADTAKTLADNLPANWKAVLFAPDPTYQGKDKKDTRTILQKHLQSYTAKHQFDYFIHKDLGGFLRRELDFYIKNEVMYLDDIENVSAPKAEEYLSKIRALRRCALPVIQMLAQLENFQKKLWLKKKFVVETRYCMTLDRVPEALYAEIAANTAQREEWVKLYAINEILSSPAGGRGVGGEGDLFAAPTVGYSEPLTVEFLKANPYLMLDTRHFDRGFALKLLASIENLDESLDGVCFHSENFQALELLQERYRESVNCVYIDPPYNSDAGPISYKNGYRHSSWVSLVADRLQSARRSLDETGIVCITIDDYESHRLRSLSESVLPEYEPLGVVVIKNNPAGRTGTVGFSICHEYALFYGQPDIARVNRLEHSETQKARYKEKDDIGFFEWTNFRKHGGLNTYRAARPRQFYPIYVHGESIRIPSMTWDNKSRQYVVHEQPTSDEEVLLPIDERGNERIWDFVVDTARKNISHFKVRKDSRGNTAIYRKWRIHSEGLLPQTWWDKSLYSAAEYGTNLLSRLFSATHAFMFPKSIHAVVDCLRVGGLRNDQEGLALDYFAGSGTTGHAVINLNREDNGMRRYVLVEMGEYFDSVLVPRLKKVVYSTDWEDGKPVPSPWPSPLWGEGGRFGGISHAFKILRLEGYEDTLNNLRLKRTPEQEAALKAAPEKARDDYLLGYFLDVESAGSASLLDLDQFRDPFAYQLKIAASSAGETVDTTIDLVETFNWLLGLKVKHIDAQKGFLTVTGERRAGGRTLVIWRTLSDDPITDNQALEAFLGKIAINPADTVFNYIYVNGSHTLTDPHNKVHLIEEAFQRLMFDVGNFESLE